MTRLLVKSSEPCARAAVVMNANARIVSDFVNVCFIVIYVSVWEVKPQ